MNPVKDVLQAVTMPFKAIFVVGLCWVINAMTFNGTWWVWWVALGMGIATIVALGRGLRTLLLGLFLWWAGRKIYQRYGQAMRERFDAWVQRTNPSWSQFADVVQAMRPGGPVVGNVDGSAVRH